MKENKNSVDDKKKRSQLFEREGWDSFNDSSPS